MLLAACVYWLMVSMRSGWLTVPRTRLFTVGMLFLGWAALSVLWSPYQAVSLQWLVSLISYAALLCVVVQLVDSTKQVRRLVMVVLGMGILEAVVGGYQCFWAVDARAVRAAGTFFNPNFFASYEMAVFALACGLLCFAHPRRPSAQTSPLALALSLKGRGKEVCEKLFLWVTVGATACAFVLAQSRGALLGMVAAVGCIGIYRFGKRFAAALLVMLLLGALIPNPLQQRILTVGDQDPYAYTRLDIWENSLQRIADHPWGVGLGQYKYTSFQYRFPIEGEIVRYGKRAESAHSGYVQMAVELGVPGLALFLVGVGLMGREIVETLHRELVPWERGVVIGLAGGMVGLLVHAAVDSVFHEPALVLLLILFAGLILALKRLKAPDPPPPWRIPFAASPARVALVGVLAILSALLIIRPAAAWHIFDQGEAEMRTGKVKAAVDWYQQATQIDPGVSAYHDAVARASVVLYHQTGDVQRLREAVDELSLALALNPLDGRLAHRLGAVYLLLAGRAEPGPLREEAIKLAAMSYEQGMAADPYSPFNYFELGRIRLIQEQGEQARTLFNSALEREPNFLPALVQLIEMALQEGRREAAESDYGRLLAIQKRYEGRTLTAMERQFLEAPYQHLGRLLGAPERSL